MAAQIKTSYPATSTVALTLTTASLASDTNLLAGRASTAVDNTTNVDLDHLLSGAIRTGTSPTVSTTIEVWAYSYLSIASGTPTYADGITGTDANKSMTSANVKNAGLRLVTAITVDNTTGRDYPIPPTSIAGLFGGVLPPFWGIFVVHNTAVALNATQVALQYERVQAQTV
ncbi:hypothetical protein [Variovorax ginsengisoli]|uniref:Phage tail protein n=1 Tax=Variovorax ginsengisoli TaxID=363844 RepID=A0ABT8SDM6_9BURK|nr:hypothetical protein [Variovorax ginsengisoli]MDN8617856.1 hypothetical protein [Variovorax ginsengisoli]MDO1537026.1 hypothetical protein [Variovorax ginsengisoli]